MYDHGKNKPSLLTLLNKKGILFADSAGPIRPGNLISDMPLVGLVLGGERGFSYVPRLNETLNFYPDIGFESWWNRVIFKKSDNSISFSRKDLIKGMRDIVGGGHISRNWNHITASLERDNPAGLMVTVGDKQSPPEFGPQYAMVRQVAYELELTLSKKCLDIFIS